MGSRRSQATKGTRNDLSGQLVSSSPIALKTKKPLDGEVFFYTIE